MPKGTYRGITEGIPERILKGNHGGIAERILEGTPGKNPERNTWSSPERNSLKELLDFRGIRKETPRESNSWRNS